MEIEPILEYNSKDELKAKIIALYLKEVKRNSALCKWILSDPKWASDKDSEYHTQCRLHKQKQIDEAEKQIKLLE